MGQILTWRAITAGHIATFENQFKIKEKCRQVLQAADCITDAFFIGSTERFDFTLRSDVDIVVGFIAKARAEVESMLDTLKKEAAKVHVPLHFRLVDNQLGKTRFHGLGPTFVRLTVNNGGHIKGDFSWLALTHGTLQDELADYLRGKMREVDFLDDPRAFTGTEKDVVKLLQVALEASLEVARTMVIADRINRKEEVGHESKGSVGETYRERMPGELSRQLEVLTQIDKDYTAHLVNIVARVQKLKEGVKGTRGKKITKQKQEAYKAQMRECQQEYKFFLGHTQLELRAAGVPSFIRGNAVWLDAMKIVAPIRR